MSLKFTSTALLTCFLTCALIFPRQADATIVEVQTVLGSFQINLTDESTPATVANFLTYVNDSAYTNSVFHRSVSGFILQSGGFIYDAVTPLAALEANDPVSNEPVFANLRGTIAMAKQANSPSSGTNQWFINVADNRGGVELAEEGLDRQNGGFTVFGQVIGDGMDVVDAIAALDTFVYDAPFTNLPLQSFSSDDFENGVAFDDSNLAIVNAIVVIDAAVDTAADLDLLENTLRGQLTEAQKAFLENRASSFSLLFLVLLLVLAGYRAYHLRRLS